MADETLQSKLQSIIGTRQDGKPNVYFQPPESVKLNYPCIVYKKSALKIDYADNKLYNNTQCYEITVIEKNPDSELALNLAKEFETISVSRYFVSDNLYHTSLVLYSKLRRINNG